MGRAEPRARLRLLRRGRGRAGLAVRRSVCARGGGDPYRSLRRRDPVGARREGDPRPLFRRRPSGAAARPDRLLERAGARRRRPARPGALARRDPFGSGRATSRRSRARLRSSRRDPAHGLASRRRGRDRRCGAVALAGTVADRAGAARPRHDCARARGRRLGVHATGARRGRAGVRGPARGRSSLRTALPGGCRPRRRGGAATGAPRAEPGRPRRESGVASPSARSRRWWP